VPGHPIGYRQFLRANRRFPAAGSMAIMWLIDPDASMNAIALGFRAYAAVLASTTLHRPRNVPPPSRRPVRTDNQFAVRRTRPVAGVSPKETQQIADNQCLEEVRRE
jgi:hypothetical protein